MSEDVLQIKVRVRDKGNITIPVKFRKLLNIEQDDILDVTIIGNSIVLSKKDYVVKKDKTSISRLLNSLKGDVASEI